MMLLTNLILGGITVVLPAETRVRGTELSLGAVAQVRGDDAALVAKAKALELGWAPAPGYTRVLQRWQIEQKLAALVGTAGVQFEGSAACRIAPETSRVAASELSTKAESELRSVFGTREIVLAAVPGLADLEIPLGEKPAELRCALEQREPHAGSWNVPVQVWVDGALYQTAWVGLTVEFFDVLPVLARAVRSGEALDATAFELRRVRIASDLGGAPLALNMLPGATALRDLAPGSVLTERDVQRAKLVKAGDSVQLQVKKGAVTARGSAIAKADGAAGDRIRVWTADKTRELTGTVIGRGLVEIELGAAP